MIHQRQFQDIEHLSLASYAMHSHDTAGRLYREEDHPYRGPFARDRDRILHSSAFRRLSGKMQVFTGRNGNLPSHAFNAYLRGVVDCPHDGPGAAG